MCEPLTAILVYARAASYWLREDAFNHAKVKRAIAGILSNGQRAADIVRLMRDSAQAPQHDPLSVDINDVVVDSLALTAPLLERHRIEHEIDLADNLGLVRGSRVQLAGLAVNLVANAVDATPSMRCARSTTGRASCGSTRG